MRGTLAAQTWLTQALAGKTDRREVADVLFQAWWCLQENKSFTENPPTEDERRAGWRTALNTKVAEIGWLARRSERSARFETLSLAQMGL